MLGVFFFQAEDGIRDLVRSRGLGDVYKRQEEFRIKRIPDPIPSLGGKLFGGNTQPGTIKAQSLSLIHI